MARGQSTDAAPTDQVFINCPFDPQYGPIFKSLIFTVFACGFRPRSALELDDDGQARMDKLYSIISECRYGIHDLSRTELDPDYALPRFNMPFELGIFIGARTYGSKEQKLKRTLILDVEKFRYQRFISDLAGFNIHAHENDIDKAVSIIRDWLANVSRRILPSGNKTVELFNRFAVESPQLAEELGFNIATMPYFDFENLVVDWLVTAPAI